MGIKVTPRPKHPRFVKPAAPSPGLRKNQKASPMEGFGSKNIANTDGGAVSKRKFPK